MALRKFEYIIKKMDFLQIFYLIFSECNRYHELKNRSLIFGPFTFFKYAIGNSNLAYGPLDVGYTK